MRGRLSILVVAIILVTCWCLVGEFKSDYRFRQAADSLATSSEVHYYRGSRYPYLDSMFGRPFAPFIATTSLEISASGYADGNISMPLGANCPADRDLIQCLRLSRSLKEFVYRGYAVSDSIVEAIPFDGLEILTIADCALCEQFWSKLEQASRIREFYYKPLVSKPLKPKEVESFGRMNGLVILSISDAELTNECLESLSLIANVKQLSLQYCDISNTDTMNKMVERQESRGCRVFIRQ